MNMLQNDLHLMEKWSKTWLLQFHPGKCVVMFVGIWWNIIQAYPYELLSTDLEHVLEEKDLGIIIDSELTFEAHRSKTGDRKPNAWPHKEELNLLHGRDCYSIV